MYTSYVFLFLIRALLFQLKVVPLTAVDCKASLLVVNSSIFCLFVCLEISISLPTILRTNFDG